MPVDLLEKDEPISNNDQIKNSVLDLLDDGLVFVVTAIENENSKNETLIPLVI